MYVYSTQRAVTARARTLARVRSPGRRWLHPRPLRRLGSEGESWSRIGRRRSGGMHQVACSVTVYFSLDFSSCKPHPIDSPIDGSHMARNNPEPDATECPLNQYPSKIICVNQERTAQSVTVYARYTVVRGRRPGPRARSGADCGVLSVVLRTDLLLGTTLSRNLRYFLIYLKAYFTIN
jgi:hypothetical protein